MVYAPSTPTKFSCVMMRLECACACMRSHIEVPLLLLLIISTTQPMLLDVEADCYWCLCKLVEGIQVGVLQLACGHGTSRCKTGYVTRICCRSPWGTACIFDEQMRADDVMY